MFVNKNSERGKSIKKRNRRQLIFEIVALLLAMIIFVFPFLHLFAVSISSSRAIMSGEVYLWPIEPQLSAWGTVFKNGDLLHSFVFTVLLTAVYTVFGLVLAILAAYPLSRKKLKGKNFFITYFMITMYFGGGLIPTYLWIDQLKLIDTFWVLVLPGAFSVFNMLILKSFMQNIPESIEEAAKIDGASDMRVLMSIILPMSMPVLATLTLFFMISRWNGFSDAIFYIPTRSEYTPLQLLLQRMLTVATDIDFIRMKRGTMISERILQESQKAANILFSLIPILLIYPWLQKYFVKGVTLGSIKE